MDNNFLDFNAFEGVYGEYSSWLWWKPLLCYIYWHFSLIYLIILSVYSLIFFSGFWKSARYSLTYVLTNKSLLMSSGHDSYSSLNLSSSSATFSTISYDFNDNAKIPKSTAEAMLLKPYYWMCHLFRFPVFFVPRTSSW